MELTHKMKVRVKFISLTTFLYICANRSGTIFEEWREYYLKIIFKKSKGHNPIK